MRQAFERTLADTLRRPVDPTPHVHFHDHGGQRHAHRHRHPDRHPHSALVTEPRHQEEGAA